MADFPLLASGAICQYPLETEITYRSQTFEFLDGTSQRFRLARPRRRWRLRLSLLTDAELAALQDFVLHVRGSSNAFTFRDPKQGVAHPNCRFEESTYSAVLEDGLTFRSDLIVEESY
jgi:hypothetical protein